VRRRATRPPRGALSKGSVTRACLRLGAAATVSALVSLVVVLFLAESPPVATWFLASAVLAALVFTAALLCAYLER
jgi:hypothetical protein